MVGLMFQRKIKKYNRDDYNSIGHRLVRLSYVIIMRNLVNNFKPYIVLLILLTTDTKTNLKKKTYHSKILILLFICPILI